MNQVLVDTCVISYLLKDDSRGRLYHKHLDARQVCLSFVSVAELYRWSLEKQWGPDRIEGLKSVLAVFALLPHDDETSWAWARVRTIKGRPVSPTDAWIAATALRHGLPLVTHNPQDFVNIPGLDVISEHFQAP